MTDGCVLVLKELSKSPTALQLILTNLPVLAELAMVDDFKHAMHLVETIFKSLTEIVKGVDKKKFRPYLEDGMLIDAAFRNARHETSNRALSAQGFILELGTVLGDNIFRGLLGMIDESYVGKFMEYKQTH